MSEFVTTSESRIVTAHGIFNNIIIYCDPEILTGQEKATIYYYDHYHDDRAYYVKYRNSVKREPKSISGQRSVYEINGYQVFYLTTGTEQTIIPETIYVVPVEQTS